MSMDAEEIALMVRELKLAKETGGGGITISKEEEKKGQERLERTVVGKIFARRQVNKETLKLHLPRIIRARGGLEMEIVGHNLFVISFTLSSDKRAAVEDGPWHFFQDLMIIKETCPMQSVAEVEFNDITMWIQCHNVPMACMDMEILERIGAKVGIVEEIDQDEGGIRLGRPIRMRVSRKLDAPLIRCVPVNTENKDAESIVIIQYEKLPHFCFACGRVGHIMKDCDDGTVNKKDLRYDHRLRVGGKYGGQAQSSWGGGPFQRRGSGLERVGCSRGVEREKGSDEEEQGESTGGEVEGAMVTVGEEKKGLETNKGHTEEEGESLGADIMEEEESQEGMKNTEREGIARENKGAMNAGVREGSGAIMNKKGGKAWKRSARERVITKEDLPESGLDSLLGGKGSKRRGLETDGEDQPPYKRLDTHDVGMDSFQSTAEAASQPRRQL